MDPHDEPLVLSTYGPTEAVIKNHLHTDPIALDACGRLTFCDDEERVPPVIPIRTGALHARESPDWMYGVNRDTVAPLKSGLNMSFNALVGGTANDEKALPKFLQIRHRTSTELIVQGRRKKDKAKSRRVICEDDKAVGFVRPPRKSAKNIEEPEE